MAARGLVLENLPRWGTLNGPDTTSERSGECSLVYDVKPELNDRVVLWLGDAEKLPVDILIVPVAANLEPRDQLGAFVIGRGGVEVFEARELAKKKLKNEVGQSKLETGEQLCTTGGRLAANRLMHVVTPIPNEKFVSAFESSLHASYVECLSSATEMGVQSIAFMPFFNGKRTQMNQQIAHLTIRAVRQFVEKHATTLRTIVFVAPATDHQILASFQSVLPLYFPRTTKEGNDAMHKFQNVNFRGESEDRKISGKVKKKDRLVLFEKLTDDDNDLRTYGRSEMELYADENPIDDCDDELNPAHFRASYSVEIVGSQVVQSITEKPFVLYNLCVRVLNDISGTSWNILHRYSEFLDLCQQLGLEGKFEFPSKTPFWLDKTDVQLTRERMKVIQRWVNNVANLNSNASSKVYDFLNSPSPGTSVRYQ